MTNSAIQSHAIQTPTDLANRRIVVAGHACLDLMPALPESIAVKPGTLTRIGPIAVSTGGAVPNVGLALQRLGKKTRLISTVGDDALGKVLTEQLRRIDPDAAASTVVKHGAATSYSIVVEVPRQDRSFWHCPGVNDEFNPADVTDALLEDAGWLHFGYPPVMRRVSSDPHGLADLFSRARRKGVRTSLDLCSIDVHSPSGAIDWCQWLAIVLPHVDFFVPSFDETVVALRRAPCELTHDAAVDLGHALRELGAEAVLLKLGEQGVHYVDAARSVFVPCFEVAFQGATGAGDATIAGFIAGMTSCRSVDASLELAVAAGGSSCECSDATSGIPSLDVLDKRIAAGWKRGVRLTPDESISPGASR